MLRPFRKDLTYEEVVPPFVVIPMGLDEAGNGPVLDPIELHKTVYQVWDACNMTVAQFDTQLEAAMEAAALNDKFCES